MRSTVLLIPLLQAAQHVLAVPAASSASHAVLPALPLCNNAGLQWAYYTDASRTDSPSDDSQYDPTVIKSAEPVEYGTTTYLNYTVQGGAIGLEEPVYEDRWLQPSSYFALGHRGYIYATRTGSYIFQATGADDISYLWVGSKAYRGWNVTNSDLTVTWDYSVLEPGTGFFSASLVAGQFYPLRFVYKQGGGAAVFAYQITDPMGNVLISSDPSVETSPDIIQYSCDGILAPTYPSFGQEN